MNTQREQFEQWLSSEFQIDLEFIISQRATDDGQVGWGDPSDQQSTQAIWNCMWASWQAATEQCVSEPTVPMPTTAAQAKGMALVGTSWLQANAPDELKPTGGGVPEAMPISPLENNGDLFALGWNACRDALLATQQPQETKL